MSKILALGLLILAVTTAATAADAAPAIKVTTKRDTDRVGVTVEKARAAVSVHSPTGISHAVVERAGAAWPDAVVLRLHLKGLEGFRATNGKVTLEAAVSVRDGRPVVRVWKNGQEATPLDAKSPYWMDVRVVGEDGTPVKGLPLAGGHFEVPLPRAFFDGNPKTITVSWVDFYRN